MLIQTFIHIFAEAENDAKNVMIKQKTEYLLKIKMI